ncbi:MAG: FAD-dependent oxidoreductase [Crocosphaera sp.]
MTKNFDIIIIGAGGVGSAAAYYLAKAKQRVLLLEQFNINHQKGSSYGYSRVIRYAYDNPIYVDLMRAAYPLWFALEKESKETLYIKTGELDFAPINAPWLIRFIPDTAYVVGFCQRGRSVITHFWSFFSRYTPPGFVA